MVSRRPRVAGVLLGDIYHEPAAQVKYGHFIHALARRFSLSSVFDVSLRGVGRYRNALRSFHPIRDTWRERFYKNIPAFKAQSQLAEGLLIQASGDADVAVQVGATFDATATELPTVLYIDYTAYLSARRSQQGRSPFSQAQRQEWLALEQKVYRQAAHICTRSRQVYDSLVDNYGIESQKITIVGGGVNYSQLPASSFRSTNSAPTALFIGKEFHRKGGDLLLKAFAEVRKMLANSRLLMVTAGPIPVGLPLDGVEFIKPTWDRQTIADLFASADVFVLPSRLETWGDVLLEAMAHHLPCIGVEGDAMGEIIVDGQTGYVLPQEDVQELVLALADLLSDAGRRQEWGAAGRRRVEESFTWGKVVERMAPVLIDACTLAEQVVAEEEYC